LRWSIPTHLPENVINHGKEEAIKPANAEWFAHHIGYGIPKTNYAVLGNVVVNMSDELTSKGIRPNAPVL